MKNQYIYQQYKMYVLKKNSKQVNAINIKKYQQKIDLLIYLMTSIKFDLTFFVDNCVRFMNNFNAKHFKVTKRI